MTTVTIVAATVQLPLAPGQVLGNYHYQILDSTGALVQAFDDTSTTAVITVTPNLVAGDYTATAQRLDSTGAAFGSTFSASFTIAPVAFGDAVASVTVTVA